MAHLVDQVGQDLGEARSLVHLGERGLEAVVTGSRRHDRRRRGLVGQDLGDRRLDLRLVDLLVVGGDRLLEVVERLHEAGLAVAYLPLDLDDPVGHLLTDESEGPGSEVVF